MSDIAKQFPLSYYDDEGHPVLAKAYEAHNGVRFVVQFDAHGRFTPDKIVSYDGRPVELCSDILFELYQDGQKADSLIRAWYASSAGRTFLAS